MPTLYIRACICDASQHTGRYWHGTSEQVQTYAKVRGSASDSLNSDKSHGHDMPVASWCRSHAHSIHSSMHLRCVCGPVDCQIRLWLLGPGVMRGYFTCHWEPALMVTVTPGTFAGNSVLACAGVKCWPVMRLPVFLEAGFPERLSEPALSSNSVGTLETAV